MTLQYRIMTCRSTKDTYGSLERTIPFFPLHNPRRVALVTQYCLLPRASPLLFLRLEYSSLCLVGLKVHCLKIERLYANQVSIIYISNISSKRFHMHCMAASDHLLDMISLEANVGQINPLERPRIDSVLLGTLSTRYMLTEPTAQANCAIVSSKAASTSCRGVFIKNILADIYDKSFPDVTADEVVGLIDVLVVILAVEDECLVALTNGYFRTIYFDWLGGVPWEAAS